MSYKEIACIIFLLLWIPFAHSFEPESLENLSLKQAEAIALTHNNTIQALYHRLNQRYYQYKERKGDFLPQATFTVDPQVEASKLKSPAELSVRQTIYNIETAYDLKESKMDYQLTQIELQKTLVDVLHQVRQAYFEVILAQHQQTIEESIVTHIREDLNRHQKELRLGTISPMEINQTKLELNKAVIEYYESQKRVKIGFYQLLTVLGFPPQTPISLVDREIFLPPIAELKRDMCLDNCPIPLFRPETALQWEQLALQYRPEIKEEEYNVSKAQLDIGRNQHPYRPNVTAFANIGHAGEYNNFSQERHWNAGVSFEWTLYDGCKRKNRLRQAKAASADAAFLEAQTRLETSNEVHRLLAEMEKEFQTYLAAKEGELIGQETIAMATRRHELGAIPYMEYLEAIRSWRETRLELFQARFDVLNAYFNLLKFSGIDIIDCE